MTLSIIIPAYNEERTIALLIERVLAAKLPAEKEVIVVDDGSTDRTPELLKRYAGRVSLYRHERNRGKGAAVRTGFAHARGDYAVVQDADLEYDPEDLSRLLRKAMDEDAPVVYGSRRLPMPGEAMRRGAWYYYLGGVAVTWAANLLYGAHLTDEPTCYKMVRRDVLERIPLSSDGFEFCPEITAKILRLDVPIAEVPIRYAPRSHAEGKKIRAKDGLIALWTLLKYRLWRP